jgi:hypothetical protein
MREEVTIKKRKKVKENARQITIGRDIKSAYNRGGGLDGPRL